MKRNKKRWTWTKKQVQKSNYKYRRLSCAPSWFCKLYDTYNKTKVKKALHKTMLNYDEDYLDFSPKYHRHCANYYWW